MNSKTQAAANNGANDDNSNGINNGGAAHIVVDGVSQVFRGDGRDVVALQGINLQIAQGQFVCLLGPSGCGKSTLLNAIAGFTLPSSGSILANGEAVRGPGPGRGMVFQEYALFPWMTVFDNVAFGLDIKGMQKAQIKERVMQLLGQLKLNEFAARYPKDLSGGMRQRVAIARILALDSPIMLMDEPFGALDALTRRNLQNELLRLWAELKKTVIFVTHSIEEAIYLADRIIVMTYRPGTVKRDIELTLPRLRDPASGEFNALKRELGALVMEEQARHESDEIRLAMVD